MRRAAGPLALFLLALGLSLAAAEAFVRWRAPAPLRPARWPCVYEPDPRFGFRYVPGAVERLEGGYAVRINRWGFHDREPRLPEDGLRVLAVGDSFTAGLHVPRARTWPQALEDALHERGYADADVVNVGLDGTGTDVHADLLRVFLPAVRPHVVVLAFFANDVMDVVHGRFARECHDGFVLSWQGEAQRAALRARVDAHRERRVLRWLFERSHLVRLVVRALEGPRSPFFMPFQQPSPAELGIDDAVRRERWPRVRAAWRDVEALARACDCRFVVVPVPPRGEPGGSLHALRRALGPTDLEVIDVVPALRRALAEAGRPVQALHFAHDAHLNAFGNRLYARAIAEAIDWEEARARP